MCAWKSIGLTCTSELIELVLENPVGDESVGEEFTPLAHAATRVRHPAVQACALAWLKEKPRRGWAWCAHLNLSCKALERMESRSEAMDMVGGSATGVPPGECSVLRSLGGVAGTIDAMFGRPLVAVVKFLLDEGGGASPGGVGAEGVPPAGAARRPPPPPGVLQALPPAARIAESRSSGAAAAAA